MEIETLLHQEIAKELKDLNDLDVGTEEHKTTVDSVTKLMDRAIEMEKLGHEHEEKEAQVKRDERSRWVQHSLTFLGIALPLAVSVWGSLKILKFEETGTVASLIGRGYANKMIPKK